MVQFSLERGYVLGVCLGKPDYLPRKPRRAGVFGENQWFLIPIPEIRQGPVIFSPKGRDRDLKFR